MLRDSEPNAVKRMLRFLEDYDKCTPAQRDQVFVPVNEEGIISLFVGAVAVFKKHHSKSKGVEKKDVLKKMDFGIVIYKIAKIYYGWKTPKLYALPGMRDQVIGGESANKFMEFIEKGRAQKMAAQAN